MLQSIDQEMIKKYNLKLSADSHDFYITYFRNDVICTLLNPIIIKCNQDCLKISTSQGNITFFRDIDFVQIGMW